MTIFCTVNMLMGFVILFVFSVPFSNLENHIIHPVEEGLWQLQHPVWCWDHSECGWGGQWSDIRLGVEWVLWLNWETIDRAVPSVEFGLLCFKEIWPITPDRTQEVISHLVSGLKDTLPSGLPCYLSSIKNTFNTLSWLAAYTGDMG